VAGLDVLCHRDNCRDAGRFLQCVRGGFRVNDEWMPLSDSDATSLREFLAERDAACPACSYNLRGLASVHCPECNQALTLRVGLMEPIGSAYIIAIVGLAIGAGAAFLTFTAVIVISLIEREFPRGYETLYLLWYPAITAMALGVPLVLLAGKRGRRWFGGRRRAVRRSAAAGAWVGTAAAFWIEIFLVLHSF
jgi:hypothetical protein